VFGLAFTGIPRPWRLVPKEPDQTLVAAFPISLRDADDKGTGGNMLFGRLHPLETTTADPVDRLAIIAEATAAFRAASDKSSNTQLLDLVGTLPTALLGATMKAASVLPFSGPTIANTTVTNVRRPNEPMYFHGARLLRVTGLGPLIGGLNRFHVVASYNGTFSIGATADRHCRRANPILHVRRTGGTQGHRIGPHRVFCGKQIYEGREYSRKVPVLRDAESVIRDQCDH
jgi:WS/DGAT C-terminal domain